MIRIIYLMFIFSTISSYSQSDSNIIDSIQTLIINKKTEYFGKKKIKIKYKKFSFLTYKINNQINVYINNLSVEEIGYDLLTGVIFEFEESYLIFKDAELKDLYRTTKIIIIDKNNFNIQSVLYYSRGHLIGISLYDYVGYDVVEKFCFINLSWHKNTLKDSDINEMTKAYWVERIYERWDNYAGNIPFVRIHKERALYNILFGS